MLSKINNSYKKVVNKILKELSVNTKQRFYEEMRKQLAEGVIQEIAVGEAMKRIGIEDLDKFYNSLIKRINYYDGK